MIRMQIVERPGVKLEPLPLEAETEDPHTEADA